MLPLPSNKPPDFDGFSIIRGCHKVTSIGAEAGIESPIIMVDGGFMLQLPGNKLPDFNGETLIGCHKVTSIGAEDGIIVYELWVIEGAYILADQTFCFGE